MKIIRLLYPDFVSGGLATYYFGANLLAHILPENGKQPLLKVEIAPPDGRERQDDDRGTDCCAEKYYGQFRRCWFDHCGVSSF